ncbi:hypothetical protein EES43_28930 [Streptomyces sp. ADI96-02]|nr:hypothetical protein EES43_28930 [Streptomyces sp. ADI96-02]
MELETVIAAWSADMEEDQGGEWARTVLHGMIHLLARQARRGMAEPEHTLARILGPLLDPSQPPARGRRLGPGR